MRLQKTHGERHAQTDPRARLESGCKHTQELGAGQGLTEVCPQNVGKSGEIGWFWCCVHPLVSKSRKNSYCVPCEIPATSPPPPAHPVLDPAWNHSHGKASEHVPVMLNWWELQENSSMRLGLEECKSIALGTTEQRGVPAAGRGNWAAAELEWCWKQESGLSSQEHTRFVMGAAGLDTTPALQPAQSSSPPRDFP